MLVGVFHMGAAGAAIATVASQGISMLLAIVYLIRKKFLFVKNPKAFVYTERRFLPYSVWGCLYPSRIRW